MKIGVYGGTFNPPHIGHVQSAETAARQLGLDLLIVVPTGTPPHKTLPAETPAAETRLHMSHLAFAGIQNLEVSDIEVNNPKASYTVDTIGAMMYNYPGAELYLLTGADMYMTLGSWKYCETLLKSVTPAVFSRNTEDRKKTEEYSREILEKFGVQTVPIKNDIIDISSSQIREMLPVREGAGYVVGATYAYIIKHRLYGAKPDWGWLRGRAHSMLNPERVPHVAGCETEALRLAERWGANIDDAREAAILHDITKKLDLDGHMKVLSEHGVDAGKLEAGEEKLLHSKSGAALARSVFGASEEVAGAIMWHTTGRPGMSALEKIIYLADYIEPTRDFPGVGALRDMAYANLDGAMRMGLEMSVEDMNERGITPNRVTFDALDDLRLDI